jgi:molybdate transport system substrate-binding protein
MDPRTINVSICTLSNSKMPKAAAAFAQFVDSAEGRAVFDRFGFSPSRNAPGVPIKGAEAAQGLSEGKSLRVYAGAGLREPMEEAAKAFHDKTGTTVQMDFDGSGILLSRLRLVRQGDLYIPGDIGYLEDAGDLVEDKTMVAYFVPVIMVPKGNPDGVESLQDLLKVSPLALGNPKACQIGRLSVKLFEKNGIDWETISDPDRTQFQSPTVNLLGVQLQTGQARATVVWDAVAAQFEDEADIVPIPIENNIISKVAVGTLSFSKDKELAGRFVDFLTGPEGQDILRKHSYRVDPPE